MDRAVFSWLLPCPLPHFLSHELDSSQLLSMHLCAMLRNGAPKFWAGSEFWQPDLLQISVTRPFLLTVAISDSKSFVLPGQVLRLLVWEIKF